MVYPLALEEAIQYASVKHMNQRRKISEYPYITHPLMVMYLVSQYNDDLDVLCAAVLHDVVEDTDTTIEDIEERFGSDITKLVAILSENKELPYKERMDEYYMRLCKSGNQEALLIKAADVLYNLRDFSYVCARYGKEKTMNLFDIQNFSQYLNYKEGQALKLHKAWTENPIIPDVLKTLKKMKG